MRASANAGRYVQIDDGPQHASADASDLGLRLLPMAEDGADSAVLQIRCFDDPRIEDRGVSASFLKEFTEQHGLRGRRDCRVEVHHWQSCGWCEACNAWVNFDASPGATQKPCAHGRWPCRTGARHAHGCHREVYPDHSIERPCSGRHATTTRQVHRDVIVPETLQRRCRYVRLMRGQTDEAGRPYYGRPLAFVSHSWDSEWAELVDAIKAHSDRHVRDHPAEEPPYYWVDIFAINQHFGTDEFHADMPDWDNMAPEKGFQHVIQRTGTVLALQDSWVDPRVLHRVWCLYEMTTALAIDSGPSRVPTCARGSHRVEGLIGGEDLRRMRATIGSSSKFGAIEEQIGRIDVRNASATVPSDRAKIFALIEREGGYEQLNERIRGTQRRLLVEHARRMLDQQWTDDELAAEPWLTRALARHGWLLPWAFRFVFLVVIGAMVCTMYMFTETFTLHASQSFFIAHYLDGLLGCVAAIVFGLGSMLVVWHLDAQRARRLGPRRDVGRAAFGELTGLSWAGVVCNFVFPIGVGLGPWAVLLVRHLAGGQDSGTYVACAIDIATGSLLLGLVVMVADLNSYSEMKARAEFMIRVARLAQLSAMLDVAERCLRNCLELCARYGDVHCPLQANARLVALLLQSGRTAEAAPHESAVRDLCATQLMGWRGFLRRYVALGAPRSLTGLVDNMSMADLGAAFAMARLHAGLQHADAAVAELERACEMGLADDGQCIVVNDELFEAVRLQKPEEFAVLRARIAENSRKRRRARVWRGLLGGLIALGLLGSFFSGFVELELAAAAAY
jgi:hypothetical protein